MLPIHITEAVAAIMNIRLNAKELRGCHYREWIDNGAVVSVFKNGAAKDQRLVELLLVRQALLDSYGITVETCYDT